MRYQIVLSARHSATLVSDAGATFRGSQCRDGSGGGLAELGYW